MERRPADEGREGKELTVRPKELFERHEANPLLTWRDWPYPVNTVFNPAATIGPKGETILVVRVEDHRGLSHLAIVQSDDGIHSWQISERARFAANPTDYPEETWGVEDARVTHLAEDGVYGMLYTAYSASGTLVSLATTKDFIHFERHGPMTCPQDKDAVLFPRRVGGRYAMLHRPTAGDAGAHVWISYSPDLVHWGGHREVMRSRVGAYWDSAKIGINVPPFETEFGWLVCFHGVKAHVSGAIYRLGLALLDRDDPAKVISRTEGWVFGPREDYETTGDVGGVVFPCGWIIDEAQDEVKLYYGGADSCVGLATARLSALLDILRAEPTRC